MTEELRQISIQVLKKDITYLKRLLTANLPREVQDKLLDAPRLPGSYGKKAGSLSDLILDALSTTRSALFTLETPNLVL